jgi:hypothetical protein
MRTDGAPRRFRAAVRASALMLALAGTAACGDGTDPVQPPAAAAITATSGDGQTVVAGSTATLTVTVTADGVPVANVAIAWTVVSGGGTVPATTTTDANGVAAAQYAVGTTSGPKSVSASLVGADGPAAAFSISVVPAAAARLVRSGGDGQTATAGQPLAQPLSVAVVDAFGNGIAGYAVAWSVTGGAASVSPAASVTDGAGVARTTVTTQPPAGQLVVTATAGGLTGSPAAFTATVTVQAVKVAEVPIPANYGLHDQFVRDGLAFLCAWNTGLLIYDVGNGMRGGSPSNPVLVSSIVTAASGVPGGAQVHNAWWYHAPGGEKRYVFVGQEGPGTIGSSSSGSIHVVDISDIANPVEVATYTLAGAGTHNFWVDEQAEILYAAYYNGGVVALDVSGTLSGNLASREISTLKPGGTGGTYVWGVMLAGGSLYAMDMLSGFWQLSSAAGVLSVAGGGNNVPERYGSDLWVANGYAYTGTWGTRFSGGTGTPGNAVKVWRLGTGGAPVLADSVVRTGVNTISDVEVSADGRLLVFSTENGPNAGIWFYSLVADPARPALVGSYLVSTGVHTATIAEIGGRRYVFAAKDPGAPSLLVLDVTGLVP